MTIVQAFEQTKIEIIGDNLIITSAAEAAELHKKFIKFRTELLSRKIIEIMPHYRGEQFYG